MKTSRAELSMVLLLLVFVGVMAWETLAMGSVARRVPVPVLLVTALLLLLQAMSEIFPAVERATRAYTARIALRDPAPPEGHEPIPAVPEEGRGLAGILWVAGLPALTWTIGLLPASLLFLLLYLRVQGAVRWVPSVLTAAGLTVGLYLVLERLFGLPLYRGLFF